ncbi:MAG TPA: polyprenyl diphosphate synthase [Candidatus Hydrogenedentes bacterium]|nr:polyprenyl diphosphate synthase [Candidatus Hydrogenedentota bacterium]HNT89597.1 polyprenyl diphosphate synthase [Candidatus Hydrogenedentota bacterium]
METAKKEQRVLDPRIDMDRLPRHIAIIMDGNGRWAARLGKTRAQGHEAGARGVRLAIEACRELGVDALSLYAFSTENWRRSATEVNTLFRLMSKYIHKEIDEIDKHRIRVRFMGRWEGLPARAVKDLRYCIERTQNNRAMDAIVAINYGGRAELADAARAIADDAAAGRLRPQDVDEQMIARRLYVPDHPEVDLLIRTSGEMRISNFMLWQISYAEIVVLPILWPDFDKQALCDAIVAYQGRSRRFGGRPETKRKGASC